MELYQIFLITIMSILILLILYADYIVIVDFMLNIRFNYFYEYPVILNIFGLILLLMCKFGFAVAIYYISIS